MQQGSKLVGTGAVGPSEQGWSVALSADGNTAIVGGMSTTRSPERRGSSPAAAGFGPSRERSWSAPARSEAGQGGSVALSADGNTAIVGGPDDNSSAGAAWVFTRSGGVWTQQGASWSAPALSEPPSKASRSRCPPTATPPSWAGLATTRTPERRGSSPAAAASGPSKQKLVGTGAVGAAYQGCSVALSADGNTAIVGGSGDNSDAGAAWVFTRSGGVWTQQGSKLVGSGAVGAAAQGYSVALSADGNTAIVGGHGDNSNTGAAWVFTRSGGVWSQQGAKLVGSGAVGAAEQGYSVAMSADGNTAIVGGARRQLISPERRGSSPAAAAVWSQQGSKLVGGGAVGHADQGFSVALSADGNTAIVGGIADKVVTGAAWVHNRRDGIWTQGPFLGY